MKIRSKLIIGYSSLLIIMLMLTFASYDRLHFMNDQLQHVYSEGYLKVKASTDMRGDVNDMARILTNMVQVKNQDYIIQERNKLEKRGESAKKKLQQLQDSLTTGEDRQMMTKIEEATLDFESYQNRLMTLLLNGEFDRANDYRISSGQGIQDRLLNTLNELRDYLDIQIETEINKANQAYNDSIQVTIITMAVGLLLGLAIVLWVLPNITKGLNTVNSMIKHFGKEQWDEIRSIPVQSKDEIGSVARVFQELADDLREKQELEKKFLQQQKDLTWINSNLARITELLHGINSLEQISQMFINEFTPILGGNVGAVYIRKESENPDELHLGAAYARNGELNSPAMFRIGEGLIGQVALDQKPLSLKETPPNYLSVRSALGEAKPAHVLIYPILFEDELLGVVELANLDQFTSLEEQLLSELTISLGVVLNNVNRRLRVEELLRESQALTEELQVQSEELQTQQEELRRSNEAMEKQTAALKRSEELLQRQQEELEHYNTELIAKTRALEEQVQEVKEKNEEIEKTRDELERHAAQLAVTSKYKSEFLANMSHELRTPLNSLLILSQLLSENKDNNLTPKQVEYAHTIHMSGSDLLKMIDEILDLSKVDAGKMEVNEEQVDIKELERFVEHNFRPVAESRGIRLRIEVSSQVPKRITTDGHRVKQILRNLLSNAFKFTNDGEVAFLVKVAAPDELPNELERNRQYLALTIRDTGIGVPEDKMDFIFEAFRQVDGTTSRKYGGTGLGLSISRGLSALLGGGIGLESKQGEGSSFTLYLPREPRSEIFRASREAAATSPAAVEEPMRLEAYAPSVPADEPTPIFNPIVDDREAIAAEDKVLLIIEDDVVFAKILLEMTRHHGFKGIVAVQGDEGLRLVHEYLPDAIILDIQLPVMDGWSILNELKSNAKTRHIPVHVISVVDDVKQGLMMGAIAYLRKPSSREHLEQAFTYIESYTEKSLKHLLVVEDDEIQQKSIIELIGHDDVAITAVSTGAEALRELRMKHYDCMVLDLMLTDMTGFELLDQIRDDEKLNDLPIIIYTGKDLDAKEETKLRKYAESIIIKDVKSPERLLDETTLFLHRIEANLPEDKRKILQKLHNKEELFEGKKILLVDDDVRNVFALSSVLEGYRMNVVYAENGREALEILEEQRDFDLILMDMMMPEMDGYEAMRRIREKTEFAKLPIIALTAKAMKEDRSKCIEAGASDYVKKPIQTDQLLSLMRVWLYS
ncbi:response regulator [Paenibacillus lentus]|uniref:Circadian input-output histidine kinase CikA n=1 Tax=Paenibacillus lentus TaxID=1338368 RepID=A0A3Q8S4E8_9BACL|nr:response regulator [Paenibacillus lentus]AZK46166.1 response regulator [Paenibacillus lentus]